MYTYDNAANREDLLDIITNITPSETQLMTGLGTSTATNILHQWLTDTLRTVGVNAFIEGTDASYSAVTNPTRLTNYTQIIRHAFRISDSERATLAAGMGDRIAYETKKELANWKNSAEFAVMRASLACGSGSSARQMRGIKSWISLAGGNYTSASGVSLTELRLNDRFQDCWDDGVQIDAVYCSMPIKRKISAFGTGLTKNVKADDRRLVNAVDVYESDAAKMVKLFPHRYVTVSGDVNYDIVGIQEDMWKVAYLRKPEVKERAITGDAMPMEVVGELTLECLNQNAGFWEQRIL